MINEKLKEEYWNVIAETRISKRISDNIKAKEQEYWDCFPDEVVEEALKIHIENYRGYKENYTRGIMRNLKKKLEVTGTVKQPKKENRFLNFEQRGYTEQDYARLERELLGLE